MDKKLGGFLQIDCSNVWDQIEALSNSFRSPAGVERRARALVSMLSGLFQARGGRWQGPIPRSNQVWENGAWLPLDQSVILHSSSEQLFIKLITSSSDLRDIALVDTYYVVSRRNN